MWFIFWNSCGAHFQALSLRGHLCPWQSPGSRIRWNTGWFKKSVPQDCHVAALLAMTDLRVCTTGSSLSLRKPLGFPRGEAVSQRLTDGGCEAEFHVDHKETRLIKQVGFRVYLLNQKEKRPAFASRFVLALPIFPARAMYCPAVKKRACGPQGSAAGGGKSDCSGWAAACLGASKAMREGLAATRTVLGRKKPQPFG